MIEECLIRKAPLEYFKEDILMECCICHKNEMSKTRCVNGHYVCDECHTNGIDMIIGLCLDEKSCNPIEIVGEMMDLPFCHTHGPEHHIMVGCALLTAYSNSGGKVELSSALNEMISRGRKVPGGAWGYSNLMTSKSLLRLGEIGGPRCCKRNSYISILTAIDYTEQITGIRMEKPEVVCRHTAANSQCIGQRCPFHP